MRKGRKAYYLAVKLLGLLFVIAFFIGQTNIGGTHAYTYIENPGGISLGGERNVAVKGADTQGGGSLEQSDPDTHTEEPVEPPEPPDPAPKKPAPSPLPPAKKDTKRAPDPITGRYLIYKGAPETGNLLSASHLLADAVSECVEHSSSGALYTIVVTEHDANMTEGAQEAIVIPEHTDITLTSDTAAPEGAWTITMTGAARHFSVKNSSFTLKNIILDGNGTGGGLDVAGSSITMESGAVIRNCLNEGADKYDGGGGINARKDSIVTMKSGAVINNCRAVNVGGGVYVDETSGFVMFDEAALSGNKAANGVGGGIFTEKYENIDIGRYAEFSDNSSYNPGVTLGEEPEEWYQEVFPTILSRYGSYYSKQSDYHPVNNFDINLHEYRVKVHYIDTDELLLFAKFPGRSPAAASSFYVPVGKSITLEEGYSDETIPRIEGYVFADWAIGSPDEKQGNTSVYMEHTMGETDIYLIYEEASLTLSVSKTVTSDVNDINKSFHFTINFYSDPRGDKPLPFGTEFAYTGGVVDGTDATAPKNGVLRLGIGGKDTFRLAHGQMISIQGIPNGVYVKIVEDVNTKLYTTSILDSANLHITVANDTGVRPVGKLPHSFEFLNNLDSVAHTNIVDYAHDLVVPLLIASTFLLLIVFAIEHLKKKVRARG